MKASISSGWRAPKLLALCSLWLATLGNIPLWVELARLPEMNDWRALWFILSFAIVIASLLMMVMSLFNWRWVIKPVIALLLFAAAFGGYFMHTYGVVIDDTMMTNALQTDMRETRDLLSWKMLGVVFGFAVLPIFWLWKTTIPFNPFWKQLKQNMGLFVASCALAVAAIIPSYQDLASTMRNHMQLRFMVNPLNSFYALSQLAVQPLQTESQSIQELGRDAKLSSIYDRQTESPLLILVVGETARSGNFGINGYVHNTTPSLLLLKKNADQRGELTSFKNVWSCGTSTATALPCMFSHLGKSEFDDNNQTIENLVDVLHHAGLAALWLENQSGCKGICDRIPNAITRTLTDPKLCTSGECFDEIMLSQISQRLATLPVDRLHRGIVVIMHQMGSHGPAYFKRSPESIKKFKPECATNILQDCTRSEVTNAYNNTILYTDHFLNKVVDYLKSIQPRAQTAMLYVADHGESLGENNIYLHGLPYAIAPDVQKRIPWIQWLSNEFMTRNKIRPACLEKQVETKISHDNYFHSVLGLMDIETSAYKPELDVFYNCKIK
ncbi:MAG TPA: phosphoethanolamine--lipid A transferase [Burkholderiaceae bacterium]|nr:phosphoethanolamine--lipid A transferase [Burkholderiaceae bacterium]